MEVKGYQIQHAIGEGGMATAYLAIQESLGRQVVLKILNADRRKSAHDHERFMNEARIIASLNHPNIITVYDVGTAADFVYMSMEYVEGGDLRQHLHAIITPYEALDVLVKIGGALAAAHRKGIIHRDVKPANILFRKDRTPLISDFGIAKQLTFDLNLTQTGIFLGSPNYMAPEQAEPGSIDGRADIYSLGVIFYEMLTGTKPYQSDSVFDVILQHKRAPIPMLPPGLERYQPLLNLMLAKERRNRFRDADSMLHYINNLMQSTALKGQTEIIRKADAEISAKHSVSLDRAREIVLPEPHASRRTIHILSALLALSIAGYCGLFYAESRINLPPGATRPEEGHSQQLLPTLSNQGPAREAGEASVSGPGPTGDEVTKALLWLAKRSLDDYRLTHPPQDNAYYYYSRLIALDPDNPTARKGLLAIAERFAFLAERELANNNLDRARSYVAVGLQIDPDSETLRMLNSLVQRPERGLMDTIAEFFRPG